MPTTEIGIEVQTISVERKLRRNRKMIRMTSSEPIITCSCTAWIDRSMNLALSSSTFSLMPGHLAVDALDLRAHALGDLHRVGARLLVTCMRTPGRPLIRSTDRLSSVESLTSAMSRR